MRFITLLFLLVFSAASAQEAKIWQKYTGKIADASIPMLMDYSYAGYKLGEKGIPKTHKQLKVFNVVNYGAIPNDSLSDQAAIQRAIDAAEKNTGGVVFFPSGEFLVNVNPAKANPVLIRSSNIILKGSGLGKNGTTIQMKDHMLQDYPNQPEWNVSYMFKFKPEITGNKSNTLITSNAREGDFVIEVADAGLFRSGGYIQLEMPYNLSVVAAEFDGKSPRSHWETVTTKGLTFVENHAIKSIDGNKITLKDPLINNVEIKTNWRANQYFPLENVAVEDIHFKANFKDKFEHHKDFLHDNAWSIISMNSVASSWVQRCRFSNVTGAVEMNNSYASSILMLLVEGNSGHKLTNVTGSCRVLTGLISDVTADGQFHGAAMSHKTSGCVIWRVKTLKQGWDSHADIPKNNLIDLYEAAKMTAHGGNYKNEPHHLKGLTLWNYKRIGEPVTDYNFWNLSGSKHLYWGFAVVSPTIVGLHGSKTTFNEANLGYIESLGKSVLPESLYEAQLKFRLKTTPKWVGESLQEWKKIESEADRSQTSADVIDIKK